MSDDRSVLGSLGFVALCLAGAISTWNAVRLAGVSPADLLFAVAAACLLVDRVLRGQLPRLPGLVVAGAALVALSALLSIVAPVSEGFLSTRFVDRADALGALRVEEANSGGVVLVKALFSLLVVPVAFASLGSSRRVRWALGSWAAGAAVSCLVAVLDTIGLTAVNLALVQQVDVTGRASGLSSQPNHLAVGAVLALPLLALTASRRRGATRLLAATAAVVTVAGIYASGSRGGAVGAAAVLAVLVLRELRGRPHAALATAGAALLAAAVAAGELVRVLQRLRVLGGGDALSDGVRAELRAQALRDFAHSPVYGIGFEQINAAHEVHLQLLASGGLLALTGYLMYVYGVLAHVRRAVDRDRLIGWAAAASVGAWLLLGLVENQLIDRYLYVPVGALLALGMRSGAVPHRSAPTPDAPRQAVAA